MRKETITTPDAPQAIGNYSQGKIIGDFLFTSGQVALVPGKGKQLDNESIGAETHRVMKNLSGILQAAGCKFADVYRSRIYIADMDVFPDVDKVYGQYFAEGQEPVRECVIAQPPLEGAHVEISMDAVIPARTTLEGEFCG